MPSPENQPLKLAGLALLGLAAGAFVWLSNQLASLALDPDAVLAFVTTTLVGVNLAAAGLITLAAGCGAPPSWQDRRKRRALLLQLLLANVLAPAALYGIVTSHVPYAEGLESSGWDVPFTIGVYIVALIAWRMWRRSQQYDAIDADTAMARDPRPPVLYLRSFKDDGASVLAMDEQRWAQRIFSVIEPPSPEQEIADILQSVGPVVAIGKPGEPLPQLGAARLYVAHDQWQAKVDALMAGAALVVLRIGDSPGVIWEIERVLERMPRTRVVFAFLSGASVAPVIAERLAPVLGVEWANALPQTPRGWTSWLWSDPRRRIGSFVYFSADGVPHVVPVRNWPFWGRDVWVTLLLRPYALPLRRAWREIFSKIGVDAGAMDRRPSRAIAVALAIAGGYAGAHWFYLGDTRRGWKYVALTPVLLASIFMGFGDALRFIWDDRATFDARAAQARSGR